MNLNIKNYIEKKLSEMNFDSVALSVIDFSNGSFDFFEKSLDETLEDNIYFDLASLTKPFVLGAVYLNDPSLFSTNMELLLEHRGSLPTWGRLSYENWKSQILSYPINSSIEKYSDFSALRLQLEIEKITKESIQNLASFYWDEEFCFWKDLPSFVSIASTGVRGQKSIRGSVHDDNSFMINEFTSHAGLFATICGLSKSLINLDKKVSLLEKMKDLLAKENGRFVKGWDRVENLETTLAGSGADLSTFGHLGFTGTSVWISCTQQKGYVLLTNETKGSWYGRKKLNKFRKDLGERVWY